MNLPARIHMSEALKSVDTECEKVKFIRHKVDVRSRIYQHKRRLYSLYERFNEERKLLTNPDTPDDKIRCSQDVIAVVYTEVQIISAILQAEMGTIDGEIEGRGKESTFESISFTDMLDSLMNGFESSEDVDYLHSDEDVLGSSFAGLPSVLNLYSGIADVDLRIKRRMAIVAGAIDEEDLPDLAGDLSGEDDDGDKPRFNLLRKKQ